MLLQLKRMAVFNELVIPETFTTEFLLLLEKRLRQLASGYRAEVAKALPAKALRELVERARVLLEEEPTLVEVRCRGVWGGLQGAIEQGERKCGVAEAWVGTLAPCYLRRTVLQPHCKAGLRNANKPALPAGGAP